MPEIPTIDDVSTVPTGDMPGDKVHITDSHVRGAQAIFGELWEQLTPLLADGGKAVVAVHGGSGVGKSETGSLLAAYLNHNGVGAYIMSGDNYPRRIPAANDAERLRIFRSAGLKGLVAANQYDASVREVLNTLQAAGQDADSGRVAEFGWLATYIRAGRRALADYLGSANEIDFDEVNRIVAAFKAGEPTLTLKRMGRSEGELWYDNVDVRDTRVLVVEWTHGNSDNLAGVDIPILLNSTPEETLAHRRSRARDGAVDSPFTSLVLSIEQGMLHAQSPKAKIILAKSGELIDHAAYARRMGGDGPDAGPMLNVYPDSLGGTLGDIVDFLGQPELRDVFSSMYILPSVFNSDLDRGFSVVSYDLNDLYAAPEDIEGLADLGIETKFDFILNHASVLSPQFQDILAKGAASEYADFFIDWNAFWAGHGEMTDEGYVQPDPELIKDMFFRKPGLPILMVRMPDGTEKPYWNTFYQEVRYPELDAQAIMKATGLQYTSADLLASRVNATIASGGRPAEADFAPLQDARDAVVELYESQRTYLGQMDLNIKSPKVWDFYADTIKRLAGYGAKIVRLDAFAYAPKEPGEKNFLNDPGTWDLLDQVKGLADRHGVSLLPEIHSRYEERIHETIAEKGFMTYDFFLPGLLIDALDRGDATVLRQWIGDIIAKGIVTVNMLGCHDGIPLLDLKGLLTDDQIDAVIERVKGRGGYVKDLHGEKKMYYQVNATYHSALGAVDERLLFARAVQMFMPGKPQVWYLDLFAGENNLAAVEKAGSGGHKEINRTNLSLDDIREGLTKPVVKDQLELLRFRKTSPAFGFDAVCTVGDTPADQLQITWTREGHTATLAADLATASFTITEHDADGTPGFHYTQSV
ncbi:sucrose phosphorylase [Propioniciclava sp.]|uniref:sucrose phosphorylase n=1 Tax=Propioniciclava sp. TaxID=2038686 RepID=UPI002625FFE4|nr:sucrose phosphorylase [Propioniciclava sp.]